MKRQILTGLIIGLFAGIVDVIPMILQNLTWDANLSALTMWLVVGFFISMVNININGAIKGVLISYLVLLPNLFIIGWNQPAVLIPIFIMTTILGALSGFVYHKIIK